MYDICVICENLVVFDVVLLCCGVLLMLLEVLLIDEVCCVKIFVVEIVQVEQNKVLKFVGVVKVSGDEVEFECLCVFVVEKKVEVVCLNEEVKVEDVCLIDLFLGIFNVFYDDVLDGVDEDDNVEICCVGSLCNFDFDFVEYFELVLVQDGMDFGVGVKLLGSWFVVLKGGVVCIYCVLVQFMLDYYVDNYGLIEIIIFVFVFEDMMYGIGQLLKFGEDSY